MDRRWMELCKDIVAAVSFWNPRDRLRLEPLHVPSETRRSRVIYRGLGVTVHERLQVYLLAS